MPFPLDDLSEPFRRPSELRRLVRAVHAADEYDEALWIEWKSRLTLDSDKGRLHLVKQILGFANRDPQAAAKWCRGNAYLVVGAEPGQLHGVAAVDPQKLTQALQPYVGTELGWTPDYIDVDGAQVLVIEIAPSEPGDPIHFLMRDLYIGRAKQTADGKADKPYGFPEGTIFIRRSGETERATHEERQMLLRRARVAGTRLRTHVVADRPQIEAAPALEEMLAGYAERERQRLLAARHRPPADQRSEQAGGLFSVNRSSRTIPEPRSQQEYAAEIDAYLDQVCQALRDAVTGDLKDHRPAHLALALVNAGEQPFTGVQVTVTVQGPGVRYIEPDWETGSENLDLPDPPKPYGTPRRVTARGSPLVNSGMHMSSALPYVPVLTDWQAEQRPDGVQITFNPVDLRAWCPGTAGARSARRRCAALALVNTIRAASYSSLRNGRRSVHHSGSSGPAGTRSRISR